MRRRGFSRRFHAARIAVTVEEIWGSGGFIRGIHRARCFSSELTAGRM